MATKTASRARTEFEDALAGLNALAAYAHHESQSPPHDVRGLSDVGAKFLATPAGRDVAKSWAVVFKDTIRLMNKFKDDDLEKRDVPDKEINQVQQATLRTIAALADRLDSLA